MNRREFNQRLCGAALSAAFARMAVCTAANRGEDYAQFLTLALEYDPQPLYGAGTPEKATPAVEKMSHPAFDPLHATFRDAVLEARKKWAS